MITVYVKNINIQSQKDYDDFINGIDIFLFECPYCHHRGCLIIHGYYERNLITVFGLLRLLVTRCKCKECGHTNAIMPTSIIPYQSLQLEDQISLIEEMETNNEITLVPNKYPYVDINYFYYLYKKFTDKWKQRMISAFMTFEDTVSELIQKSWKHYHCQFLQIHRLINGLAMANHIT